MFIRLTRRRENVESAVRWIRRWINPQIGLCVEKIGPSGITVGRDRVRQSRTGRFLEVFDVSITPRSSLDGHELTVDPFGDNIRDSMRIVRHDQVPSRMPEKLTAALPFHFSAPHFSALASHCRNKKTDWQKEEGQKDRRHLGISSSSTLRLFFAT